MDFALRVLLGLAFLALGILVVAVALQFRKDGRAPNFFLIFSLFFVIYYVAPGVVFYGGLLEPVDTRLLGNNFLAGWPAVSAYLYILLSFLVISTGYYAGLYVKPLETSVSLVDLSAARICLILLLVWVVSIVVYLVQAGGFSDTVLQARAWRAGGADRPELSFMKRFFSAVTYSALLAGIALTDPKNKSHAILRLYFVAAIAAVAITCVVISARGPLLYTFLMLILAIGFLNSLRKAAIYSAFATAFAMFWLTLADPMLWGIVAALEGGEFKTEFWQRATVLNEPVNFMAAFASDFRHPIESLESALESIQKGDSPRLGLDVLYAFIGLPPQAWVSFSAPDSIAFINTENLIGISKSQIWPGLLAFSVYSFSFAGLAFLFLFGLFGSFLERVFIRWRCTPVGSWIYLVVGWLWGWRLMIGEPRVFLNSEFLIIVVVLGVIGCMWFVRGAGRRSY